MAFLSIPGPAFLALYCVGFLLSLAFREVLVTALQSPSSPAPHNDLSGLHPYEVAYLNGGAAAVGDAAVTALVHEGHLVYSDGSLERAETSPPEALESSPSAMAAYRQLGTKKPRHPVEAALLEEVEKKGSLSIGQARLAVAQQADRINQRLCELELTIKKSSHRWALLVSLLPLYTVAGAGISKAALGFARGRPVAFIVILLALSFYVLFKIGWHLPHLTRRGSKALNTLRDENAALKQTARSEPLQVNANEAALAYGLFGTAALGGGLSVLANAFVLGRQGPTTSSTRATSSVMSGHIGANSCGSSCGSCGSGCGGGCGGCGG